MTWTTIDITDKIKYLKDLVLNTTDYTDGDLNIVNALITGSMNHFSGEIGFDVEAHHMTYLRKSWDTAIANQKDDSVINIIKTKLKINNNIF